ncbi:MAG TPA: hypothetical protein VGY54_00505 [Polyangiaceae bacterium]|jgi:hypothetical protein|nr:hypothetical protein [Polyangiaceae bacterium]
MAGLTLDTGALIALEKHRRGMTKAVEAARKRRSRSRCLRTPLRSGGEAGPTNVITAADSL